MKITGSNVVEQPVAAVWDAILDPRVLVSTIPGCERLEPTGPHAYAMTVTAGVAAIKGTYTGTCVLSDLDPHSSLTMRLAGSGAPGTVDATVLVRFSEAAPGATEIAYDADATVGGMVGGVGQRMLTSVSKRMAGEFFHNVAANLTEPSGTKSLGPGRSSGDVPAGEGASESSGTKPLGPGRLPAYYRDDAVPGRAPRAPGAAAGQEFLKGVAVGAGLVVLGVVVGGVFGRRR